MWKKPIGAGECSAGVVGESMRQEPLGREVWVYE